MALHVPTFLIQAGQHSWVVVLGATAVLGYVAWSHWSPPRTPVTQADEKTVKVPKVATDRHVLEKQVDEQAKENRQQGEMLARLETLLRERDREAKDAARRAAQEREEQAKMFAALGHRLEEMAKRAPQQATGGKTETARPPVVKTLPVPPPPAPAPATFELRTLEAKPRSQPRTLPPRADRAETAYLGTGCFARIKVVTGVMATSQLSGTTWGHPVLLSVTEAFDCPWLLGQPGEVPRRSQIPLQGCFMLGHAKADMSSSRAMVALDQLACVMPGGAFFEEPIKGYVTDADGTLGLVGTVHTHDSAKIAKAFLTGLIQEASAAFGLARSSFVVTGTGQQPFQGTQTTLQQVANFYLEQARALLPTLWVPSKTPGYGVLQESVELPAYPVVAFLRGGHE